MPEHYEYNQIREKLIRCVAEGEMTPWWAEAEAAAKGVGPLAHEAGFDPFTHKDAQRWSLPMVLAWIIWRLPSPVCDAWPEHRRHTKIWWGPSEQKCVVDRDHDHENTSLIGDERYRTYLSWALARPPEVSLSEVMTKAGHELGASAQSELWGRLNAGEILAQGMPYGDKFPRNILETEWNSAEPLGWDRHEGWRADDIGTSTDEAPRYRDVSVARKDVLRIWPPGKGMVAAADGASFVPGAEIGLPGGSRTLPVSNAAMKTFIENYLKESKGVGNERTILPAAMTQFKENIVTRGIYRKAYKELFPEVRPGPRTKSITEP